MRNAISTALTAAMLCLVGTTGDADAAITISLEWTGCGGGASGCSATGGSHLDINPGGGQTLRLDVYLTHDLPQGLESHTFSLDFDVVGLNNLNLGPMAQTEWAGSDVDPNPGGSEIYGPLTVGMTTRESTAGVVGRINSIESAGFLDLPANGTVYSVGAFSATAPDRYRVAQAYFSVNSAAPITTIFSGLFNTGFDQFVLGDGLSTIIDPGAVTFGTATVGIPEPGTLSLLGLGLAGLVLAGRYRRRS